MLPAAVKDVLYKHLQDVKRLHEEDLQKGLERVALPNALDRKYPNADKEWGGQWVFPATSHYTDQVTEEKRRHHLNESVLQETVKDARLKGYHREASRAAHDAPFFCHPSPGGRLSY